MYMIKRATFPLFSVLPLQPVFVLPVMNTVSRFQLPLNGCEGAGKQTVGVAVPFVIFFLFIHSSFIKTCMWRGNEHFRPWLNKCIGDSYGWCVSSIELRDKCM